MDSLRSMRLSQEHAVFGGIALTPWLQTGSGIVHYHQYEVGRRLFRKPEPRLGFAVEEII